MLFVCSNLDFTITSAVLVKPVVRLFAGDCLEETSVVPTEQDVTEPSTRTFFVHFLFLFISSTRIFLKYC